MPCYLLGDSFISQAQGLERQAQGGRMNCCVAEETRRCGVLRMSAGCLNTECLLGGVNHRCVEYFSEPQPFDSESGSRGWFNERWPRSATKHPH